MDVILFNPPRYVNGHFHKFNNALLWLASYLHERDIEVRIVPLVDDGFEETVREEIARYRPSIVAVSCKWWDTLYSSSYIADLSKQADPNICTVAGGHTASFFARQLVDQTAFDVVIRGDGEGPLFDLVNGNRPTNCVFAGDTNIAPLEDGYFHNGENIGDSRLVPDIADLISIPRVLNSFVWTGKGCAEQCVYCAGNIWNTSRCFGRGKLVYRSHGAVLSDIEILTSQLRGDRVTFDFEPTRGNVDKDYYYELFRRINAGQSSVYFFSWSLPTKKMVDELARNFKFVELCIDVQTGSERLRKHLGSRGFLKPFFGDDDFDELMQHLEQYPNIVVDASTMMGLPFERDEDVDAAVAFADRAYDRYESLRYPYVSPMNVEPGSLLLHRPEDYEMVLLRKNFDDFYAYTKRSFEKNINCYQPEVYDDGAFHPLGIVSKERFEKGDLLGAYESWKKVQRHVDVRSREKMLQRARKYIEYGVTKIGIKGGVDRGAVVSKEVE